MSQTERPETELTLPSFSDDEDEALFTGAPALHARPWWRRRGPIILICLILLIIILGGSLLAILRARRTQTTYQSQNVTAGTLNLQVTATGPLQGTIYNVSSPTSGKISAIYVNVGQQVRRGDLLAKLDPTSLQDAVNNAQAQVDSAQTSVADAQANQASVQSQSRASVNTARDQETNALYACDHPAANQVAPPRCRHVAHDQFTQAQKQAAAQNATAQSQIDSAQSQLATANAQLRTAEHNLQNTSLTAPHAGTVATINGTVGSIPGGSGSTSSGTSVAGAGAFVQIVDLSTLQVSTNVNEADIGGVNIGEKATFSVSAYPNQVFSGTISAFSPLGQTVSNVVTYPVTISVDMDQLQNAHLLPGMTANVQITTLQRTNVLLIPAEAVNFARTAAVPDTTTGVRLITADQIASALSAARNLQSNLQSSQPQITSDGPVPAYLLQRSNNQFVLKPVVLGLSNGSVYEVLAGLAQGESIVVGVQAPGTNSQRQGGFFRGGSRTQTVLPV